MSCLIDVLHNLAYIKSFSPSISQQHTLTIKTRKSWFRVALLGKSGNSTIHLIPMKYFPDKWRNSSMNRVNYPMQRLNYSVLKRGGECRCSEVMETILIYIYYCCLDRSIVFYIYGTLYLGYYDTWLYTTQQLALLLRCKWWITDPKWERYSSIAGLLI